MKSDPALRELGEGVRRCRERAGLSQEELASRADLHRNYVGYIERGERNPSVMTLIVLARALNISPAEFWGPVAPDFSRSAES